ncbi:dicarboxylate/amino acid:cation symporter [Roseibacillus ishigakijimensis]|uniref:Dicarboxylate/amino acid:cation symporter n=1 Tax=Roseibacillus ishigakijimensis TaxID=454146 RepID=A0A934RND2_9BACT|nr:dicarboxylate/amino acid:cation symporter [Roseibacillus ishigakijimensis]MBK1832827.1 dicarboxylate/amino acid:cation symporter [Roseibacillus ishigakijimensis]
MKLKGKDHWWILGALAIAVALAIVLRSLPESQFTIFVVEGSRFLGDLFKLALKMLIVPLVTTSVIAGISSLGAMEGFARLGGKTIAFYALSSFLAIVMGLIFVNLLQPGLVEGEPNAVLREVFSESETRAGESERGTIEQAVGNSDRKAGDLRDLFRKMFPENIFAAATDNGQLLGLITFSLLFAIAMTRLPAEEGAFLSRTFQGLNEVMVTVTRWVMATAPVGIFGLILPVVYDTGLDLFAKMALYFGTVLASLGFHFFITLPALLFFLGRVNPLAHFGAMKTALVMAFSTASSSATLPVTMRNVQENSGVSKRTSSFTLPLGATVNMDGTALYECVAVIFVAQVMGISLGFSEQFVVVVSALLTSVGVAGIPSASLVAILLILKSANIPGAEAAAFAILAVDRPLDMCRTAVNVFGDSCAAVVVARSEGESLPALTIKGAQS